MAEETDAARLGEKCSKYGIPAGDILPIRDSMDFEERRSSVSANAQDFDNGSGVLAVKYLTNRARIISFQLDPDGTRFRFFWNPRR